MLLRIVVLLLFWQRWLLVVMGDEPRRRGEVDEVEEQYLRQTMAEADLLRHLDLKHGLGLFREFASYDDVLSPEGRVFAMLDRAAELKGGRQIVHASAVGMSGLHGTPTEKEREALEEISNKLGVNS